jgi:hypothetical protein
MAAPKVKTVACYMDGIDWRYELRHASDGTKLFPSRAALKRNIGHDLEDCGIVQVQVRFVRWVKKPSK